MKFVSVCSGIEAASVAWKPLGWEALAFSEIEAFPSKVLAHHYSAVPNMGDMTKYAEWSGVDLSDADALVGGTPCQAFSFAGLRQSLKDARGNLTLTYIKLADHIDEKRNAAGRPAIICVWENVPGVLNTEDNAFGCFLGGLAGSGGPVEPPDPEQGWANAGYVRGPARAVAWRVLDAQYFGLAQRRKRVFVVASAREGFRPETVLFELEGVRWNPPPSREAGQRAAPTISARTKGGGGLGADAEIDGALIPEKVGALTAKGPEAMGAPEVDAEHYITSKWPAEVAPTLTRAYGEKQGLEDQHALNGAGLFVLSSGQANAAISKDKAHTLDCLHEAQIVAHPLKAEGADGSEDGTGRGVPLVPVGVVSYNGKITGDVATTLATQSGDGVSAGPSVMVPIAFTAKDHGADATEECAPTVRSGGGYGENGGVMPAVAFALRGRKDGAQPEVSGEQTNALRAASGGSSRDYVAEMAVRRLTPVECERLQGFPDNYTLIPIGKKQAADGPRYKALGNSMAVPVMAWIGRRIKIALAHGGEIPHQ